MMKHIKKKTVNYIKKPLELSDEILSLMSSPSDMMKFSEKELKDKHALLLTEDGMMVHAFPFSHKSQMFAIPLANPVLIYFHSAQQRLSRVISLKDDFLNGHTEADIIGENSLNLLFNFFGELSGFVVLLMTSLEAFINQSIPDDFSYSVKEGNKFMKVYNRDQIQRWVPFDDKVNNVLNVVSKKKFATAHRTKQPFIDSLKKLRDEIVHTKRSEGYDMYAQLFKKALEFKSEEALEAVKAFINYYDNNLIEPCGCGADF